MQIEEKIELRITNLVFVNLPLDNGCNFSTWSAGSCAIVVLWRMAKLLFHRSVTSWWIAFEVINVVGFSLVQWLSCVVVLYSSLDRQPSAQALTLQVRSLVLAVWCVHPECLSGFLGHAKCLFLLMPTSDYFFIDPMFMLSSHIITIPFCSAQS